MPRNDTAPHSTPKRGQKTSPVSQCGDCGYTWGGHREGHCARCHAHFSSDSAFHRHLAELRCPGTQPPRHVQARLKHGRIVWGCPGDRVDQ